MTECTLVELKKYLIQDCQITKPNTYTITNFHINIPKGAIGKRFNIKNLKSLNSILSFETWESTYCKITVDEANDSFLSTLKMAIDTSCPRNLQKHTKKIQPTHYLDTETRLDFLIVLMKGQAM